MSIRPLFAWYDAWVGFFWDSAKCRLYVLPIPCVGVVIDFGKGDTKRLIEQEATRADMLQELAAELVREVERDNGRSQQGASFSVWLHQGINTAKRVVYERDDALARVRELERTLAFNEKTLADLSSACEGMRELYAKAKHRIAELEASCNQTAKERDANFWEAQRAKGELEMAILDRDQARRERDEARVLARGLEDDNEGCLV